MSHHKHHEEKKPALTLPLPLPILNAQDLEILRKSLPELSTVGQQIIGMIIKAYEKSADMLNISHLAEKIPGIPEQLLSPEMMSSIAPLLSKLAADKDSLQDLIASLKTENA